ncbi:N-formylglutamate amidohydrolase [Flavobacteriaceae bacterium 3-367]
MKLFKITSPTVAQVPIIISIPHAGTRLPSELKKHYKKGMRRHLDDTDWFVHRLYEFAPSLGITLIKANLSRWVIDLNRSPESIPLYSDDRLITPNTPTTDFYGNSLYKSKELEPDKDEVARRLQGYYRPYHQQVAQLLEERKKTFGQVLLWDAHSIRHRVSTIQKDPFPDMILGNNDERTAHPKLIRTALKGLNSGRFEVHHNHPFKGGHITRSFGKPENGVHALQLEMNKILYMDDNELTYNEDRASKVQKVLRTTLEGLIKTMEHSL